MRVPHQRLNPIKPKAGLSGAPSEPIPRPKIRTLRQAQGRLWGTQLFSLSAILIFSCVLHQGMTQTAHAQPSEPKQLVIIDTDIGDDIDDAFALGLALQSPEFRILGVTTAFGNTAMRQQLTMKFLEATGFSEVPVAAGVPTEGKTTFTQGIYTNGGQIIPATKMSGPDFILDQIRKHPSEITLIAIGPQTNLGAAIDKDAATFRKLKHIVMMGGAVYKGYKGGAPDPEWNILCDIPAAQKVFTSGVPLYVMPLDSTILKLDASDRNALFDHHTPITDQIHILYDEWSGTTKQETPTLFDPMAVGYAANPELCPTTPLHLTVDDKGFTRPGPGAPNAQVCLKANAESFYPFVLKRLESPVRSGSVLGPAAQVAVPQ